MGGIDVVVVRTGTANIASVLAGLRRTGATPRLSDDPDDVRSAGRVVLPGVGTLAAAMETLRRNGMDEALRERVSAGGATMAVCLGLQMLCKSSQESPGVEGLGVVDAHVTRFAEGLTVPQLGWNQVEPQPGCMMLEPGYAYFANSYCLVEPPDGWHAAITDHGGPFVAAMERGSVLACQFHPELSGKWGLALIRRWIDRGGESC
jgi:imidazole glycerol phosphate synthase glutamine amidotransferase subunit